jgi:ABC-2 type transport system ATP-binding protein
MKKKKIPLIIFGIILIASTLYFEFFRKLDFDSDVISGSGTIEVTEIKISSKIAGRVAGLPKPEGSDVNPGDLVARLEYEELSAQRLSAKANFDNAEKNYNRVKDLYKSGSISRKDLDNAEAAFRMARAGYDQVSAAIENAVIYSPIDGTVLDTNVEVGEMAFPGTPILTIADLTRPWMYIYVNEKRLGFVKIGQLVKVYIDSFPDKAFPGKIVSISNKAEFTPKTIQTKDERVKLVFAVKVMIENPDLILKPGMPADARNYNIRRYKVIAVKNITKRFGDITAVDDLSFEVQKGEIFGIVGPDGAGKSTLLRMMSGILLPGSGVVEINGKNIQSNLYRIKENLAYMPQRFGLYEDLTVEENIFFFGRLFGVSKKEIKERTPGLYEFSRLEPFKDRLAGKLSGGMKQKLGLACSLIHSPDLILLDEPTNGVDPVSRREFWKILYTLLGDGVTIIVSTAYLDEAERCNRVAMMDKGKFIRNGKPSDIKKSIGGVMLEIVTDNVWRAEEVIMNYLKNENVIREGNSLKIFVSSGIKEKETIKRILEKEKVNVSSVRIKVPTLENCFMEIVADNG